MVLGEPKSPVITYPFSLIKRDESTDFSKTGLLFIYSWHNPESSREITVGSFYDGKQMVRSTLHTFKFKWGILDELSLPLNSLKNLRDL